MASISKYRPPVSLRYNDSNFRITLRILNQLLFDLASDNKIQEDFQMNKQRFAFGIMMASIYGLRVTNWDAEDMRHAPGECMYTRAGHDSQCIYG